MKYIKGWKTITSCLVLAGVTIAQFLGLVTPETGQVIMKLAEALGIYGIYDRIKNPA